MSYNENIVKEVVQILSDYSMRDRLKNIDNVALVLAGVFAYFQTQANKKDCREIVERAMNQIGW